MCRDIGTMPNFEPGADGEDTEAAGVQFVRRVADTTKQSKTNHEAFDKAAHAVIGGRQA